MGGSGVVLGLELASELVDDGLALAGTTGVEVSRRGLCRLGLGLRLCSRLGLDGGSGRLGALSLTSSTFVLGSTLTRGLLGGKAGTALGKGLLLCGRGRLDGILVRIGIVIDGSLLGLDRSRSGLAYRIDNLGLNNSRHLFLRLAELTDGTADRAAHLRELIRAKQQKAEDHDDRKLTLSNTKHTYLQGSM